MSLVPYYPEIPFLTLLCLPYPTMPSLPYYAFLTLLPILIVDHPALVSQNQCDGKQGHEYVILASFPWLDLGNNSR